jgi:hypothetical protein
MNKAQFVFAAIQLLTNMGGTVALDHQHAAEKLAWSYAIDAIGDTWLFDDGSKLRINSNYPLGLVL